MSLVQLNMDKLKSDQQKLAYYLIALCVACIGFTVSQTMSYSLSLEMIPLALSILCFLLSGFYGFKLITNGFENHKIEIYYALRTDESSALYDPNAPLNPTRFKLIGDNIKFWSKEVKDDREEIGRKHKFYHKMQLGTFYSAVILFIIWRVLEMIIITNYT